MKNSLFRYLCLAVALVSCNLAGAQQKANYQLAEKFRLLEQNPIDKYSTEVRPTFINDTDCFYYLKSASNLNDNLNCSKELEHYAS